MKKIASMASSNQQNVYGTMYKNFQKKEKALTAKTIGSKKPDEISKSEHMAKKEAKVAPSRKAMKEVTANQQEAVGKAKAPITALAILNRKAFFAPGEEVRITVQGEQGEHGAKPEISCSQDGTRWSSDCPGVLMRQIGNQWMVRSTAPGKYKFALKDAEEGFEVSAVRGTAFAPSNAAAPKAKIPESASKEAKAVIPAVPKGTPHLSIGQRTFTGNSKVRLSVRAESGFRIRYVLEKKENGVYREVAKSDKPEFDVGPGEYRVKAGYENGGFGPPVVFSVRVPVMKAPAGENPRRAVTSERRTIKAQQ